MQRETKKVGRGHLLICAALDKVSISGGEEKPTDGMFTLYVLKTYIPVFSE